MAATPARDRADVRVNTESRELMVVREQGGWSQVVVSYSVLYLRAAKRLHKRLKPASTV